MTMKVESGSMAEQSMDLGSYKNSVEQSIGALSGANFAGRLWRKDAGLWKQEPEHQKIINNSLGWLQIADFMEGKLGEILSFADEVKKDKVSDVVLLGMGGSSLAAEVFRLCLPAKKGYPKLHVLDSTDPGWVGLIEKSVKLDRTLFIVSSKSGTTIEPHCFYSYFYDRVQENGRQFVAVTDPGSFLGNMAKERGFRKIFINPSDIGGRFSALSYFGLVPAAIAGMDVRGLVESAKAMAKLCGPDVPLNNNPAVQLGCAMGELAKSGRDKVTLAFPKDFEAFGLWIEQLVAESSGKEGKGIVPIAGESLSIPDRYGRDRFFVWITTGKSGKSKWKSKSGALKAHPSASIHVPKPTDLGGEFLRWEIATATACSVLGVNAFDQPNVQEAKDLTKILLKELTDKGSLPILASQIKERDFEASFSRESLKFMAPLISDPVKLFQSFLRKVNPGEYIGILAYLPFSPAIDKKLVQFRTVLRKGTKASTLFGYGPRYLHSTGQLHKGGANNGVFVILTALPQKDLEVPGQNYTFGQLEMAQALGDFQALDSKGRRVVRLHLSPSLARSLAAVVRFVDLAVEP